MSISGTSGTGSTVPAGYTTKASATADQIDNPNAALSKNDFLQMLVTKLQNQDPLSAVDDSTMVADMAQFSSVEQMTNVDTSLTTLNTNIVGLMAMQNTTQAAALIGKTATVTVDAAAGTTDTGLVSGVKFDSGTPMIVVNGKEYSLSAVTQLQA